MTEDQMVLDYRNLSDEQQAKFLCSLGGRLSTLAREVLLPQFDPPHDLRQPAAYNEILHTIFGHLGHLLGRSDKRYSDETLIRSIADKAEEALLMRQFDGAWTDALNFVKKPAS